MRTFSVKRERSPSLNYSSNEEDVATFGRGSSSGRKVESASEEWESESEEEGEVRAGAGSGSPFRQLTKEEQKLWDELITPDPALSSSSSSNINKRVKLEDENDEEPWMVKQRSVLSTLTSLRSSAVSAHSSALALLQPKADRVLAAQLAIELTLSRLKKEEQELQEAEREKRKGEWEVSWAWKKVVVEDRKGDRYKKAVSEFEKALAELVA